MSTLPQSFIMRAFSIKYSGTVTGSREPPGESHRLGRCVKNGDTPGLYVHHDLCGYTRVYCARVARSEVVVAGNTRKRAQAE
eukprot:3938998-Rhodomonas_salina.1